MSPHSLTGARDAITLLALAVVMFFARSIGADALADPQPAPAIVAMAEQFVLRSKHSHREFLIQVSFPQRMRPGEKAAALYVLDGNSAFGLFTDSVRVLDPSAIGTTYVVAIGYENSADSGAERQIDFAHVKGRIRGSQLGGGGMAFERFILEELRPFIESRYPVDPDKAVLFGHSLGGLFVATVLANNPRAFSGYLISSPSLQFDPTLAERVRSASTQGQDRRVYLSVGSEEGRVAIPAAEALHGALTMSGSTFRTRYCRVPGYYHMSVTLTLASVALPFLIPPKEPADVTRKCPSAVAERSEQ